MFDKLFIEFWLYYNLDQCFSELLVSFAFIQV